MTDGRHGTITEVDGDTLQVACDGDDLFYNRSAVQALYRVIERSEVRAVWKRMCDDARKGSL